MQDMSESPVPTTPGSGPATIDDALRVDWRELADATAAPPSAHPEYVQAWARCYARGAAIAPVVVRDDSGLRGLMPLIASPDGSHTGMAEAEDFAIVADGSARARAVAVAALAVDTKRLILSPVLEDGPTDRALRAAADAAERRVAVRPVAERPVVQTDGDWEAYWSDRGGKLRGEVRRLRRRLGDLGEVTEDPGRELSDLEGRLREFMELEASGWKGEAGSALTQREHERELFMALARWAAGKGWLRMPTLRLDGRTVAAQLNVEAHGVKYGLKMGYDRELRKLAPGMLLLATEIERAFADPGIALYDLEGDMSEAYKARWATAGRPYLELTIFPSTTSGTAAWLTQAHLRPALGRARRALDRD
jgi:CelD/BcsL family acetyltransferase involved in cellulose biosynthesis